MLWLGGSTLPRHASLASQGVLYLSKGSQEQARRDSLIMIMVVVLATAKVNKDVIVMTGKDENLRMCQARDLVA